MKEIGIIMSGDHPLKCLDGTKTQTRRVLTPHNSEVGEGRVDWAKFCWDGSAIYSDPISHDYEGLVCERKAPLPFVDGKPETGEYLHVPYNWQNDMTIYRIYPRYEVGDRLWVRETYCPTPSRVIYKADYEKLDPQQKWRPSIFMPRWASRILLEITEVRASRVQSITEEDAKSEGANGFLTEKFKYGESYRVFKPYHKDYYPLVDHADIGDIVRFQGPNLGFACFQSKNPKCKGGTLNIDVKEAFDYVGLVEPDYRNGFRILWDSLNAKRGYGWDENKWVWPITFKNLETK